MLYWLLFLKLQHYFPPFRIFRYLTFRTAFASLTALFTALIVGPLVISRLREFQIGQYIREEGPKAHQKKAGTPTMGGLLIAIAIVVPTLLWADLSNRFVWIAVFATCAFAAIGFTDDYTKVAHRRNLGLDRASQAGTADCDQHCDRGDADRHADLRHVFDQADCAVPQAVSSRSGGGDSGAFSASLAAGVSALYRLRGAGDCGLEQRRESYGWAGRAGHWLHGDCGGRADRADLCERARDFCDVSGNSAHAAGRRADDFLRSDGGVVDRISRGTTRIRRKCSWATWDRWRWAARLGRSR